MTPLENVLRQHKKTSPGRQVWAWQRWIKPENHNLKREILLAGFVGKRVTLQYTIFYFFIHSSGAMLPGVILGFCSIFFASSHPLRHQYGIIIDAGSTSSKVHVYRWIPKKSIDDIPNFEEILYKKFRPGVASFFSELDKLEEYFEDILAVLGNDVMPTQEVNRTRISVLATAGNAYSPRSSTPNTCILKWYNNFLLQAIS